MAINQLISVYDFCGHHQLEVAFVQTLDQQGLIETISVDESLYIQPDQLAPLEKLVRLHQELAIHADDLDIVSELLNRIETLQQQVGQLQTQLAFYERG